MAENEEKPVPKIDGISTNYLTNDLTVIDLSHSGLSVIDESFKFPVNLREINISHNSLVCVPQIVLCLQNLKRLDISWNSIQYFDDIPCFCHSIEELDISNNKLLGPPYWIWSESPKKLTKIDISNNIHIASSLNTEYLSELLQYRPQVQELIIFNCKLGNYLELLSTFPRAKSIILGTKDLSYLSANILKDAPCVGLNKCYDIEKLSFHYTFVCDVLPDIASYKNLKEIDLSQNKITGLPKEFCSLENLEVCLLSFNCILYLPNEFVNLKKLKVLHIDSNELCMLPENMDKLENLRTLDVYDNFLSEPPDIKMYDEIDLAQNYFDEPSESLYLDKRNKLRLHNVDRCCGRKSELIHDDSEHTPKTSDSESMLCENHEDSTALQERPPSSSSEDWDSEDWWQPCHYQPRTVMPPQSQWLTFVQRKMNDGNFCPSDMHTISIADRVKYEKMCKKHTIKEVEGQFDDLSDDNS